ncbi:MAG: helix-turn-helix domain-containing protein [Solirubrobacteraceae bacterium]
MPDVVESDSGPPARALRAWTPLSRALTATGDHWTLSIVLALAPGRTRLTRLHRRLPGISTGVLERGLQQMVALGLVTRTRFKEMPPRVELELTDAGRELLPVAGALARWGMRHMWSQPSEHEHADLRVLLRLLPALVDATGLPDGDLQALVADADPPIRYCYQIEDGHLRIDPGPEEEAAATASEMPGPDETNAAHRAAATPERVSAEIQGDADAWIAALGPSADHSHLQLTGDEHLANAVLAGLPGPADRGL